MTTGTRTRNAETLDLTRPGIIEASAGTGKTFAIAEIYLALLRGKTAYPQEAKSAAEADSSARERRAARVGEILVVTFTEAATAELRERLCARIRTARKSTDTPDAERAALLLAEAEFDEAAVSTIHGFCSRALKEFGAAAARTDKIVASTADELSRFVERRLARARIGGEKNLSSVGVEDVLRAMNPFLQNPATVPVPPPPDDARGNALFGIVAETLPEWRAARGNGRDISYGEILLELLNALRETPELAGKIASRFRAAIVDEFQDTDPVQWEIFRRIFIENKRPIFCVGDPKQAIYEFRGGDVRAYRNARTEILDAGRGNTLSLGENWRSEPETIAAFNEIFQGDARVSDTLFFGGSKTRRSIRARIGGTLEYSPVAFPQSKAEKLGAEKIAARERVPAAVLRTFAAATNRDVALNGSVIPRVVKDVLELVRDRGVPASDIAILVFDNEEAGAFRSALMRADVPVSTTARGNVLCRPIARELSDIVHAMLLPQDNALFRRARLTSFFAGTPLRNLSADGDSPEIDAARRAFVEARERWSRNGFLPAFRCLSDRLEFSKNFASLPQAKTLATDVPHLAELIHAKERGGALSPRMLADAFDFMLASADPSDESDAVQLRSDSDGESVKILTVHKSKGLEFEIVFVSSLWKKQLLSTSKRGLPDFAKCGGNDGETRVIFDARPAKEKSEEFLRGVAETAAANAASLFYVALTRARSRVVLCHVPQKQGACKSIWNSYQNQILDAAGIFLSGAEKAFPHWKIVDEYESLPEDAFPPRSGDARSVPAEKEKLPMLAGEDAERRFAHAENALKRISRDAEGVFSFSRLIRNSESESLARRENDENPAGTPDDDGDGGFSSDAGTPTEDRENGGGGEEEFFPRRDFFDLPAGPEFGTLVHLVFEKTDFRSRANLSRILDAFLPQLPNWAGAEERERATLKKRFAEMVESALSLPLGKENIRLETLGESDVVREMEFHFPIKRSRALTAELYRIFKSWGGIYAETAERHWAPDARAAGTPLNVVGMMTGVIDLAFRANGRYFILDWKTNAVAPRGVPADYRLSSAAVREETVRHGYALQWTIYAVALRRFLSRSLGENYVHDRDFGGVVYLFVRWLAPLCDAGTLTSARLDELEQALFL